VIEIGAEAAHSNVGGEIPVRRGNDAHVDDAKYVVADGLDLVSLDGAKQPWLACLGQLAYLVEEEGSPVSADESPLALAVRAGKRAPPMSEKLALAVGLSG
jgi:hypothetical protein